jgi:hypothetical protein
MRTNYYLLKNIVYLPTWGAFTKTGALRVVEPVGVVPLSNTVGLRAAFREVLARGNPAVPPLFGDQLNQRILPKYTGVKSDRAFYRRAESWSIEEKDGLYKIIGKQRRPDAGWKDDPKQTIDFPPGTKVDDVIDRAIALMEEKVRRQVQ